MLHKAVYWQLIVANPAERVQPPKARKPKEDLMMMNKLNITRKFRTII